MLRPAPAPAARDWRAPKDAMGFTEELVLEVGEEPAVQRRENKNQLWHISKQTDILPIQISQTEETADSINVTDQITKDSFLKQLMGSIKTKGT